MYKIAIAGVGGMGGNIGGYLTRGGQDITMICMSWKENARVMKEKGLTLINPSKAITRVKPEVIFVDELPLLQKKFDILFICMSSNDTIKTLETMGPYMNSDCWVVSPQNGINEDTLIPLIGVQNVIPCVSYTGGGFIEPGVVTMHDGYFVIGELNGKITPRIRELARMLSLVVPTYISSDIMKERWHKLCIAAMVGPVSQIYGFNYGFLRGVFQNEKTRQVLARFVSEVSRLAEVTGYKLDYVEGIAVEDWRQYARGKMPELSEKIAEVGNKFPDQAPTRMTDRSGNYQRTFSHEMEYINGYIINKGKNLGVPTPVNELIVRMIRDLENGKIQSGPENIETILKTTEIP